MTVSVVIPTYNAARFVSQTLDAVLAQTTPADEIIVMDDGSTDGTLAILNRYGKAIAVHSQSNQGVAHARNRLCALAKSDLLAFVDHDDVWHPRYLEVQQRNFANHPFAAAYFTGHVDFVGEQLHAWTGDDPAVQTSMELIARSQFLRRYASQTGRFASMSYCCIPKRVLPRLGNEPFSTQVSGADDFYLFNLLPLVGSVVYAPQVLVAYRITSEAQSNDQLKSCRLAVEAFDVLHERYRARADRSLCREFESAFASKSRHYAKVLLGLDRTKEARHQLWRSICVSDSLGSKLKSSALLMATFLPSACQPRWLPAHRCAQMPSTQCRPTQRVGRH